MKNINCKCPNCKTVVEFDSKAESGFCSNCGTKINIKEVMDNEKNIEKNLADAKKYFDKEDFNKALVAINKLLEIDSTNVEAIRLITLIDVKMFEDEFKLNLVNDIYDITNVADKYSLAKRANEVKVNINRLKGVAEYREFANMLDVRFNRVISASSPKAKSNTGLIIGIIVGILVFGLIVVGVITALFVGIFNTKVYTKNEVHKKYTYVIPSTSKRTTISYVPRTTERTTTTSRYDYNADKVKVYVFYGATCSYCAALHEFFDELENDYNYKNKFEIKYYEVWNNSSNYELMMKVANKMGDNVGGVPYYIIGDKSFNGYAESLNEDIKKAIDNGSNVDILESID